MKPTLFIVIVALLSACKNINNYHATHLPPADTSLNYLYQFIGDSVQMPPVKLYVHLSPLAEQKLKTDKETAVLEIMYSGVPFDTCTQKDYKEAGEIIFIRKNIELTESQHIKLEGIKISKQVYNGLINKNFHLFIYGFSGRHSSPDNILDINILSEDVSKLKDSTYIITGKLYKVE